MLEQLVQLLQLKIIFLPWIKFFPSIPECICRFSPLSIQMFSCEPWVGATTGVIGCRARIQLTSMGGCRGILGRSRRSPASTDPWDWAGQLGGEGGTSRGTEVAGFCRIQFGRCFSSPPTSATKRPDNHVLHAKKTGLALHFNSSNQ